MELGLKLLSMKAYGTVIPKVGGGVHGTVGLCITVFCGSLRLYGNLINLRFPTTAEIAFPKFPLDISVRLDMEVIPLTLSMNAYLTFEEPIFGSKITMYNKNVWRYSARMTRSNIFDTHNRRPDESPPSFQDYTVKARSATLSTGGFSGAVVIPGHAGQCFVKQIPNRDITDPALHIEVAVENDKSLVKTFYSVGTVPGGADVVNNREFTGPTAVIPDTVSKRHTRKL